MNVDLLDRLRCPNDHADTWLVATAARTAHRRLIEATLGCPACSAEFDVRDGAVIFGAVPDVAEETTAMVASEPEVMRAAALLGVQEGGLYLLDAGWGSLARALSALMPAQYLLADPPAGEVAHGASGVLRGIGNRWPLATASLQGIALERITPQLVNDAVRLLKPHGRLIAPVTAPLPAGTSELARDARHWLAEKPSEVVPLRRAPP